MVISKKLSENKKLRILLIYPPITTEEIYAKFSPWAPCLPPLGLCYIASALLNNGYQVKILDCVAERLSLKQIKDEIIKFVPTIVGVSSTTVAYFRARQILRLVKGIDRRIKTILGGAHITTSPVQTMQECEYLNIGIIGEGEITIVEIMKRIEKRDSMEDIQGILFRENGVIIVNKPRPPIKNLDQIIYPARHLLKDLRVYSHTPFRGSGLTTTMITSRGCPFNCYYCDTSVFDRVWRAHSPRYVVSEMFHLKKRYGVNFLSIEDDNFFISKSRTKDICRMMIEKAVDLKWTCSGRADAVNKELLSLMKDAGCQSIYLGIESGSPRILELINRGVSIEQIKKGIKLIKDSGIDVIGSFILGLPSETKQEVEKTIDFALSLPLDGVSFFLFVPYPNTKLREVAFEYGQVSSNWGDYATHPKLPPFIPWDFSPKYLLKMQRRAYKKFLFRPKYIATHLNIFLNRSTLKKALFDYLKGSVLKCLGR